MPSAQTAMIRPILRDPKTGRVLPGCAALNPGGRPRGVPALIDRIGGEHGIEGVIQFLFDVATGKLSSMTRVADRIVAARELLDRRFGKAPLTIAAETPTQEGRQLTAHDTGALVGMRDDLEAKLRELEERASADEDEATGDGVAAIDVP